MDKKSELMHTRLKKLLPRASAPFSRFHVAALAVTKTGEIFEGVNVESDSYGLTNCAERTAIFAAVTAGARRGDIAEIHLMAETDRHIRPVTPCGACRQVIAEQSAGQAVIHIYDEKGMAETMTIAQLLPGVFGLA